MNRFKVSKFKNASCINPKRETWITGVRTGSPSSCGNHIKASCAFMAFNSDSPGGGRLGLLDTQTVGRQDQAHPLLHAHSALVTDFDFSPFNDYLLATCSQDKTVKIWGLPENSITESVSSPSCAFHGFERRVENVLFHPSASEIIAASTHKLLKIFDLGKQQEAFVMEVSKDQLQGISWKMDGSLLATTSKDKKLRILDPRANSKILETNGHDSIRDSRVCWLGGRDLLVSTGFDSNRERELKVWDVRHFGSSTSSVRMGTSTGVLIPLYDIDSGLLFLCGKGDQRIGVFEIPNGGSNVSAGAVYSSDLQQKGACLVPKRALDVMSCEVSRILQLTDKAIIPLKVEVPRTSHINFYPELFPDTASGVAALTAAQWIAGENAEVTRISLDPVKRKDRMPTKAQSPSAGAPENQNKGGGDVSSNQSTKPTAKSTGVDKDAQSSNTEQTPDKTSDHTQKVSSLSVMPSSSASASAASAASAEATSSKAGDEARNTSPKKKFTMAQTSKFRHLQGTLGQRNQHIYNIRNASINVFGECDGFHANEKWAAVPLSGSGGLITVIDVNRPGKLQETGVPTIQNGATMMDFMWDPFNSDRLAVACDDAKIRIWSFDDKGFEGTLTEPDFYLRGHDEKIYFIRFHPLASDVLLSASFDMTMKIWDLTTGEVMYSLDGHTDQIFSAAWSPDGRRVATVCKDGQIRVYEPRKSSTPAAEGPGPEGSRGARILWVHNGDLLFISGFDRDSRICSLHDPGDLSRNVADEEIDKNPAMLLPYYDPDTHIVFMSGKGERVVTCFEILKEAPYFLPLSSYTSPSPHQALSFLPKTSCAVKDVEFMRALMLTKTTIEPIHITLPRVKKEYFQDDVFPDTRITWEPVMTGTDWFSGKDGQFKYMCLCPEGMSYLSSIPKAGPAPKKYTSENELSYKTDAEKRDEIMAAMTNKLALKSEPLPQEEFEGVDDDEWDD